MNVVSLNYEKDFGKETGINENETERSFVSYEKKKISRGSNRGQKFSLTAWPKFISFSSFAQSENIEKHI